MKKDRSEIGPTVKILIQLFVMLSSTKDADSSLLFESLFLSGDDGWSVILQDQKLNTNLVQLSHSTLALDGSDQSHYIWYFASNPILSGTNTGSLAKKMFATLNLR